MSDHSSPTEQREAGPERDFHADFDLESPELATHYEEVMAGFHSDGCPVARSNVGEGYWVLTRYDDVRNAAQDWQTFSSKSGYLPNRPADMQFYYPTECDPPFHTEVRKDLNKYFGVKEVKAKEAEIQGHVDDLIDSFIDKGEVEIVSEFANQLPGRVFFTTFAGMPAEDLPEIQQTLHLAMLGPLEKRGEEFEKAYKYFGNYLALRREEDPRGDVIDEILGLDFPGYGWEDKVGTLTLLTLGGIGTSGYVISGALYHLSRNLDDRRRLQEDDSRMPIAVEEFLRYYTASPHDGRRATCDVEVSGTTIAAGDYVLLGYGEACRDPEVFEDPGEIDITRSPSRHLAFSAGPHRCIGSHVARMQIRLALSTFLRRIPDFDVVDGFEPIYETAVTRTMDRLPLVF
jgi:cytochrome P450